MLHVVMRPISGPEGDIPSGTIVEPEGWTNADVLIKGTYLRPLNQKDMSELKGLDEIEVDDYGISTINLFEPKPKPKAASIRIPKKKKRA
jgi:hypothetical protein